MRIDSVVFNWVRSPLPCQKPDLKIRTFFKFYAYAQLEYLAGIFSRIRLKNRNLIPIKYSSEIFCFLWALVNFAFNWGNPKGKSDCFRGEKKKSLKQLKCQNLIVTINSSQ